MKEELFYFVYRYFKHGTFTGTHKAEVGNRNCVGIIKSFGVLALYLISWHLNDEQTKLSRSQRLE